MGRCFFACFGSNSKDDKNPRHSVPTHQRSSTLHQRNAITSSIQHSSSVHTLLHDSNNNPFHSVLQAAGNMMSTREDVCCTKPHEHEKEEKLSKSSKPESSSEDFSVPLNPNFTSPCQCPPIHRYNNCMDMDSDDEVLSDHVCTEDDNDDENELVCSMGGGYTWMYDSGLNPNTARHRNADICPVLKPVENVCEWNAVKSKGALIIPSTTPHKASSSGNEEFPPQSSKSSRELRVDASLSNWLLPLPLPSSEVTTPVSKKIKISSSSRLSSTMDLEGSTSSSSSSSSPVKSSTSQGLSSMRTYCRQGVRDKEDHDSTASSFKGIPNTTSKYREDKTVKWHSTPFETRLERALNSKEVAKA